MHSLLKISQTALSLAAFSFAPIMGFANSDLVAPDAMLLVQNQTNQDSAPDQEPSNRDGSSDQGRQDEEIAEAGSESSGASGVEKGQAGVSAPIYMLVPLEIAENDNSMRKGCWAKLYERENFMGDNLTLVGPAALADLTGPFGLNWDDKVNSIETGPKAIVTVYDNVNYRDQVSQFKPGQRVADVSKRLGFFDEFASVRISCNKS